MKDVFDLIGFIVFFMFGFIFLAADGVICKIIGIFCMLVPILLIILIIISDMKK